MARSRIAVMGASSLLVLAATLGSAAAQPAGGPLPLLQIDHAATAVHAHHKPALRLARAKSSERTERRHIARHMARRVHTKTRVADAGHDLPAPPAAPPQTTPPQPAPQNGAQNIWPATAAALPSSVAMPAAGSADTMAAAPAPGVTTERVVDTSPNGILNGGHTVPAAMPAAATPAAATPAAAAPKPQPAAAQPAAASPIPPVKVAAAPAASRAPIRAMLFKLSTSSPVGSASWIAQLLAALGGAIAAGAVAWFLIRPKAERTYS